MRITSNLPVELRIMIHECLQEHELKQVRLVSKSLNLFQRLKTVISVVFCTNPSLIATYLAVNPSIHEYAVSAYIYTFAEVVCF